MTDSSKHAGTDNVALRPATEADWAQICNWLRLPHVQRWWGPASGGEAAVRIVFETPTAVARIVDCDGEQIGYAHAIEATHWGEELPEGMPPGTWDVDLFIASVPHRGRGLGKVILDQLAEEIFSTTMAIALSVFVSVRNEAAVRAYEKAGFKWERVWNDPIDGPCWMLLRHRP